MANISAHGDNPGQNRPPVNEVDPGGTSAAVEKNLAADIIGAAVTPTAAAAAAKYGFQALNTYLTQRGETRREQLRQDGETTRAIIAGQAPPATPPESPQQ